MGCAAAAERIDLPGSAFEFVLKGRKQPRGSAHRLARDASQSPRNQDFVPLDGRPAASVARSRRDCPRRGNDAVSSNTVFMSELSDRYLYMRSRAAVRFGTATALKVSAPGTVVTPTRFLGGALSRTKNNFGGHSTEEGSRDPALLTSGALGRGSRIRRPKESRSGQCSACRSCRPKLPWPSLPLPISR